MKKIRKWYPLCALLVLYLVSNTIAKPLEQSLLVASKQELKGLVIVVDAGHGGKDNGASVGDVIEDEINLAVALELKELLELAGAQVILTRKEDNDLAAKEAINRKKEDLQKRVELIEKEDVALFVSIHMNKYGNTQVSGAQVFYRVNDDVSKLLANLLQEEFKELKSSKKVKIGNYYILNNSTKPGVLIECGFMSHPEELELLQQKEYQIKISNAIYRGIASFIKKHYILI